MRGFTEFWSEYPKRHGKREGRGKAEAQWRKLSLDDRKAAWRGARCYAAAVDADLTIAADAFRWLRDRRWVDWQERATADRPATNGTVRSAAARELGFDLLRDRLETGAGT